jgi:hypothetical protein
VNKNFKNLGKKYINPESKIRKTGNESYKNENEKEKWKES